MTSIKYWLTDYAATLLASSQHNAEVAKGQLDVDLETIAPVDAKGVAAVEQDVDALWALALKASEAYSSDDSARGNALMAQAQSRILNVNNEMCQGAPSTPSNKRDASNPFCGSQHRLKVPFKLKIMTMCGGTVFSASD